MQATSDDSKSVLVYGTVALGLITFTLPKLLDFSIRTACYLVVLFLGVGGLLIASLIFFWYSRRLTMMVNKFGGLLYDMTVKESFNKKYFTEQIEEIKLFKKTYVRRLIKLAKVLGGGGAFLYFLAIVFYLIQRLSHQ